ncbi:hypothetical protein LXL04_023010 [Taraxacum kok-saghyz]
MISFRKTERPVKFFEKTHNVALTTYFRLMVSSPKTRIRVWRYGLGYVGFGGMAPTLSQTVHIRRIVKSIIPATIVSCKTAPNQKKRYLPGVATTMSTPEKRTSMKSVEPIWVFVPVKRKEKRTPRIDFIGFKSIKHEPSSFPRVHNFPIYAGTARSGNRVYVSSRKVAERKTKEIGIKSILCIPHEIRSRNGCGAKIEIKSILFKSRLGVDGIGMESAIHRNRNASGNDCDRVWDRLLQSENLKITPLKIVQRRAEERAEEHLKWNRRRRARAEEMEMIEAVQVVNRGNGEKHACRGIEEGVQENPGPCGVPARCAGDSFIWRMISFRKTERPVKFFEKTHNVALTTYFRLMVSSPKTRIRVWRYGLGYVGFGGMAPTLSQTVHIRRIVKSIIPATIVSCKTAPNQKKRYLPGVATTMSTPLSISQSGTLQMFGFCSNHLYVEENCLTNSNFIEYNLNEVSCIQEKRTSMKSVEPIWVFVPVKRKEKRTPRIDFIGFKSIKHEPSSFPRVHNFPIYAGTARSGNRVYVSSRKVAERKTKEIGIKSILCIPHEIRSRNGCGAKIEIKSILFKSRLGVDGIGMESAIHRNRNASGNDCDRVWDRLLQSENLKITPLKIVQRRAEERAEEHLKWNRRRRARAEEMEMIEAVQVVNRGNGEKHACRGIEEGVQENPGPCGVPARCAGDSFIWRMISFRKTERPVKFFEKTHNVALTTYFRLMVSSPKTRIRVWRYGLGYVGFGGMAPTLSQTVHIRRIVKSIIPATIVSCKTAPNQKKRYLPGVATTMSTPEKRTSMKSVEPIWVFVPVKRKEKRTPRIDFIGFKSIKHEPSSFPRVHNFPIYAGTARSGNRVYVSSRKVAERKTKEIEIKSILCIPHEIRSRNGCGAKIEIKSILFKSRLGVDGIGMESAIHRNRNASGNDCDRVWDRLLQSKI